MSFTFAEKGKVYSSSRPQRRTGGMTMCNRWIRWIVAVMMVVGLAGMAEAATPDISGKSWVMTGSVSASAKGMDKLKLKGAYQMHVGLNGDEGLEAGQWKLVDPSGDELTGTYQERQDKLGKGIFTFTSNPVSLGEYLMAKALEATEEQEDIDILDMQVVSEICYPKAKLGSKGLSLTATSKIVANMTVEIDGVESQVVLKVAVSLKGNYEIPIAGSHWVVTGKSKFSCSGLGSYKDEYLAELWLGPNGDKGLAENGWLAMGDDQSELRGTYALDGKKIELFGLEGYYEEEIEIYVEEAFHKQGIYDFTITEINLSDYKSSGTIKPGISLSISSGVKFVGSAMVEGELGSGKGGYSEKITGVPADD